MKYSPYTIIPASVIANIKEKYENFDGKGFTVVETSHRSNAYSKLNEETQSLVLQYFQVSEEEYECLLLPSGTATSAIFYNCLHEDVPIFYHVTGQTSQEAYKQMLNIHKKTYKIESAADIKEEKGIIHMNGIEGARVNEVQTGDHWTIKNMDYWRKQMKEVGKADMMYMESGFGLGMGGFAVWVLKRQILQWNKRPDCPDMVDWLKMSKARSIVNTPNTLCTLVLNQYVKHLLQNHSAIVNTIKQNVEQFISFLSPKATIINQYNNILELTTPIKELQQYCRPYGGHWIVWVQESNNDKYIQYLWE